MRSSTGGGGSASTGGGVECVESDVESDVECVRWGCLHRTIESIAIQYYCIV
jgi:hypothetical protein